ncbi:MAG TPA: hypothetical protein V6C81_25445 [Planktothrix sp.]|jgi:hypothetical protein
MATGLSRKQQVREGGSRAPHQVPDVERQVAVFVFGATLTILAFLLYGSRSDLPDIQRHASPVHILHHSDVY